MFEQPRLDAEMSAGIGVHHFVALHLVPFSTGQPPCSAPESSRPSVCRLQNATAEPAAGFTAKPFIAHAE